jgi:hypothetical protein
MFEWLNELPVSWANNITVVLFVLIAVACFAIPRSSVIADAPTNARWRDLRWWAVALIAVQLGIYVLFR